MKNIILIFLSVLLSGCAVMRGMLYTAPNVGDNQLFSNYEFHDVDGSEKLINLVFSPEIDKSFFEDSQTSFMGYHRRDTLHVCYGDGIYMSQQHDVFSITKSVVSLLIGIAIEKGYIGGVDDLVVEYLPQLDASFNRTTLKELLQMRSGISNNPMSDMMLYYGNNIDRSVLNSKIIAEQVGRFEYSNVSTQLLGMVIEKATSVSLDQYFRSELWEPMRMDDASWSMDSRHYHNTRSFVGLSLKLNDLIKIGRLIIDNGIFEGKQIVPRDWLERITKVEIKERTYIDGYYYNYHWRAVGDSIIYAKGLFGQILYIDIANEFVGVRLGEKESKVDWVDAFGVISKEGCDSFCQFARCQ